MYSELIGNMALPVSGSTESLASTAVIKRYAVGIGMNIRQVAFLVTTAPTTTAPVIVLKKYPVAGSSAGAVSLATLTLPVGTAAGSVVYKKLDSITLEAGQELVMEVTTAAAAGAGYSLIEAYHAPEDVQNLSNCIASV
jgi:hypothetical protein